MNTRFGIRSYTDHDITGAPLGKLQQGLRLGRLLVGLRRLGGLRAGDVVLLVEQLLPYTYMLRLGARLLNCTASESKSNRLQLKIIASKASFSSTSASIASSAEDSCLLLCRSRVFA